MVCILIFDCVTVKVENNHPANTTNPLRLLLTLGSPLPWSEQHIHTLIVAYRNATP